MRIVIFGTGGFGREVLTLIKEINETMYHFSPEVVFSVDDGYKTSEYVDLHKVIPKAGISVSDETIIAVGNPYDRKRIAETIKSNFGMFVHPTAIGAHRNNLSHGSVVCAGCILTTNIKIGIHAQLNLQTTIGHDCVIGDYFTTAPGVHISGSCKIGNNVYLGTGAMLRQGVTICDDVTVGMGAIVLNDITEPGTYVGSPVRKIK